MQYLQHLVIISARVSPFSNNYSGIDDEILDDDENLFADMQEKVHDSRWAPHGSKPVCVPKYSFLYIFSYTSEFIDVFP